MASKVTFGIGVVSRPLLLLLPAALKDPTEPSSCLDGELRDSAEGGAFGLSSSGWAKTVASTKNHQNLISSLLPLFHGIVCLHFTPSSQPAHHLTSLSLSFCHSSPLSDVCFSALTTERVWPEGGWRGDTRGAMRGGGGCHGAGCDTRPPHHCMFILL